MPENKIRATLRIPTKHQYAFVEIVVEGTLEEVMKTYCEAMTVYQRTQKQWDKDNEQPF